MRTLVEFMATDKALAGLSKSLTIYGQAFNSVDVFTSVLQVILHELLCPVPWKFPIVILMT